ncbi:PAS domain-containing protein [Dongia deserti]|uniref:PAS domain-containing protein n=1 Tax=Dongia deserti TaxID=2268030 RepID=UPI000E6567C7|nr:PAS domain-containing protein [Dongia deserti]
MNSLSGPVPGELSEAATAVRRALLLTVREDGFQAIDSALAALDRPPAERVDSAEQAIATLRTGGFDLTIVDLVREGTQHLAAIEILRGDALLASIVCVAVSADVQSTPTQKAIEIGIDDILREPLDRSVARLCFSACLERRKLREDSLQYWTATANDESDDHPRALLDALPEAVVALREDGAIDLANAAAERMFGLSGSALIGTPFSALVSRAVDDGRGATWTPEALTNLRGPSTAILRLPGGFSRPVEILANTYQRFGRSLIACVLREVDWAIPRSNAATGPIHSALQSDGPNGLRANAELLHELAKEVTTRLDLIGRNINMMSDEVFGPVGVAIYKSYLSEALGGIDQARALLDGAAHPDKERRKDSGAETALRELVTDIIAKRQRNAERRRTVIETEIESSAALVHLPRRLLGKVIEAQLDFALACVEHGGEIVLRAQCGSDERLLLTIQTSGCAQSAAEVLKAAREPTDRKSAQRPLTIAWNALRSAAKVLDGVAEIDVAEGKGAMVVAMLPQRRRSDRE